MFFSWDNLHFSIWCLKIVFCLRLFTRLFLVSVVADIYCYFASLLILSLIVFMIPQIWCLVVCTWFCKWEQISSLSVKKGMLDTCWRFATIFLVSVWSTISTDNIIFFSYIKWNWAPANSFSVYHTTDVSEFIHCVFYKLVEEPKELGSHANQVDDIQKKCIDEFKKAYEVFWQYILVWLSWHLGGVPARYHYYGATRLHHGD